MRVLITGAAGFVGLNLLRRFAAGGAAVDALARRAPDAAAEAFLAEVADRITWRLGDVTDRDGCAALVAATPPDAIVHAAAVTFTPDQEHAEPARVFDVNAGGTLNLLEAARLHRVPTFVYVSSGGLYGAAPPAPAMDESTPMRPVNMYAIAKIASEQLCGRYAELGMVEARVGRLGTAYGPMERTTGSRSNLSAVHQVVQASAGGAPLRVAGAGIARDFCHIDDVAEAFWLLCVAPTLPETVYNVSAPVARPLSVALEVVAAERPDFSWCSVDDLEDADVRQTPANARAAMDITRLNRATGWRPMHSLEDGVRAYLSWRSAHPEIVTRIESSAKR
jgi:UDP-glucose 4-epimerase